MKRSLLSLALALVVQLGFIQKAAAFIELNAFYYSDTLTTTATQSTGRMFIEGAIGFGIDSKKRYSVGWNYSMMTATDAATKTGTYSSTQMGPRFLVFLDHNFAWSIGLGYYLVSKATYDSGSGSSSEWKGTALKFDVGYNMPISDDFFLGVRMNYSSATYSESLTSGTYSTSANARTMMYPSISAVYIF